MLTAAWERLIVDYSITVRRFQSKWLQKQVKYVSKMYLKGAYIWLFMWGQGQPHVVPRSWPHLVTWHLNK